MVWAIKKFNNYLDGKHFILRTDSRAVTWLNRFKEDKTKLIRWALLLQEYSFEIQHVKGSENHLPDAMSRSPIEESVDDEPYDWDRMVFPASNPGTQQNNLNYISEGDFPERIKQHQEKDTFCINIKKILQSTNEESNSNQNIKKSYVIKQNILYNKPKNASKWCVLVPKSMVLEIVHLHHNNDLYEHPGTAQTLKFIKEFYTWKGMTTDVRKYVRGCDTCSRVKTAGRTIQSQLVPRKVVAPMHTISVDLMGPYTRTKISNNCNGPIQPMDGSLSSI